jgi:hypothetical protein
MAESDNVGVGAAEGFAVVDARVDLVNKQAQQIQTSAKTFAASAGKGFKVDPEAAATLIRACQHALLELSELSESLDAVAKPPRLGESPGGTVVAAFTQKVASDEHGIAPAIVKLKETLHAMITAYRAASTDYAETEAIIQRSLKAEEMNYGSH